MTEQQEEELEVLNSIYEGDNNFTVINSTTFQYKYECENKNRSFVLEIQWGPNYPEAVPIINLDVFYNKHLLPKVKEIMHAALLEQAEISLGMSMTFTLFEWLKDAKDDLLFDQPDEAIPPSVISSTEIESIKDITLNESGKIKKEQLTKAQKRRMWDKQNAAGERERGWNWVDIVRHLSQTGPSD